jgi:hypothetical protein
MVKSDIFSLQWEGGGWPGAKQPPNELCLELVSLVFLHTFFSLAHSSARNHATRFSMFFNKSEGQQVFWANVLHQGVADTETHDLPCRKRSTNHCHTIRHTKESGLLLLQTQRQKTPKPVLDRAH